METRTPGEEEKIAIRATKDMIKNLPTEEKESRQIYAIRTGCQVHFSSVWDRNHENYHLDAKAEGGQQAAWFPCKYQIGEWI